MHPEPPAMLPNTSEVTAESTSQTQPIERRRPGRVAYTNPHLIALLRRHSPAGPVERSDATADANARRPAYDFPKPAFVQLPAAKGMPEAPGDEPDQFAATRGISIGLLIAVPLWAGIVAFGWWLIDR
jgi:hypothetical protein